MIGTVPYGHVAIVSPYSAPLPPTSAPRVGWGGVGGGVLCHGGSNSYRLQQ